MIHPLQLASAMLVLMFATALLAGTHVFKQEQFGKQQRIPAAVPVAALPM